MNMVYHGLSITCMVCLYWLKAIYVLRHTLPWLVEHLGDFISQKLPILASLTFLSYSRFKIFKMGIERSIQTW